jgi:hypothetical protein
MAADTPPEHRNAEIDHKQPERTQADQYRIMDVAKKPTEFSDFPVEIKEQIYEHAMRNEGRFDLPLQIRFPDLVNSPYCPFPVLPRVCFINKDERAIATLVLVRNSVLYLRHASDATVLLEWIDGMAISKKRFFLAISKMRVVFDPSLRGGLMDSLSFASKCQALTDLTITIHVDELLCPDSDMIAAVSYATATGDRAGLDIHEPPMLTLAQMVLKFGLTGISGCTELQRLTLDMQDFLYLPETEEKAVEEMAEWCRNAFKQVNGRAINVEIA